jgi:hypothetical protein
LFHWGSGRRRAQSGLARAKPAAKDASAFRPG